MEKLEYSFEISKSLFIDLYRIHVRYKFKLRRSMFMSVCLLMFGVSMQYIFKMDFGFINTVVFWITFASIVINLLSDYVMPKTAYNNLVMNHGEKGSITCNEDGFDFIFADHKEPKVWVNFDSCIETENAFLLYKKDILTIVLKAENYTNQIRELFKKNINNDKTIVFRR